MNHCECTGANNSTTAGSNQSFTRPQYETRQDENGATLHVALPGVAKEDLKLTLHESNLRIEGQRTDAVPDAWKTHRDNGASPRYRLDIRLTNRFDGTKTTASLDSGILVLQVPVREESKPRQIQVN